MNFLRNLIFPLFYFETPGVAAGSPPDPALGGGAGNPAPGTPPQGQGQPPVGAAQPQGVRQFFPDVSDEHWAIMEPHVGRFEGTVTQLQQQAAAFKPLVDAGYDAQRLQGLVGFETKFAQNPLQTWLELGEMLQQPGEGGVPPAVHPDVDLEYLAAIARGEDPDVGAPGVPPGQPGVSQPGQVTPELAQAHAAIETLTQQVAQLQQGLQQDQTARETAVQDQFYARRMGQMKEALMKGGWPEELLDEKTLGAHVITHRGDFAAAAQSLIAQRASLLKGITDPRLNPNDPNNPGPTTLPNGAPASPDRDVRNRDKNDPWKTGTRNAAARLARLNQPG